jgi:toxin HigB-1
VFPQLDKCNQNSYIMVMIKTFRDQRTEDIFNGKRIRGIDPKLVQKARRRLEFLHAALKIEDLYFPPSNRFHALHGFTPTRYAIWVNDQWRISFEWQENHAFDVYFEDYH